MEKMNFEELLRAMDELGLAEAFLESLTTKVMQERLI